MNHANLQNNSILATALRILSEQAAPESLASTEWSNALVSELIPFFPPAPAASADLMAPQDGGPGLRWHADQLLSLCQARTEESPTNRARRAYHARMLGHGLAPERKEFRPLVTVLLPVYNRAGPLIEAVQSCIDQTWRPIEILVVDDGSTDDLRSTLCRFGDQVRLIRKDNGGVASARNLGLREARGDFIQFLDSDDLLVPDAVANAVAAFNAIADADLCHGQGQWIDMRTTPPRKKDLHFRQHPNPVRSLIVEFAFAVPTVMIPRWRMLATPPFEEDLRRSSDWRYWQRLGFANIKVVGIRTLSAHLRRFEHSLQATPHPEDDSHAVAVLRGLRDLFQHPHAWAYAVEYTNLLIMPRVQPWFAKPPSRRIAAVLAEITAALQPGSTTGREHGLSMLPVLAALRGRIEKMARHGHWPDREPGSVYRTLRTFVSDAIGGTTPISARDIAFWTREPEQPIRHRDLHEFFADLKRRCAPNGTAMICDALLRGCRKVPPRRSARVAARLQPFVGARLASAVAVTQARFKRA